MENNQGFNQQPQQPQQGGAGLAIASMVLGICSIVFCCVWYLSAVLAIVGLVLAIVSLKGEKPGRGMAIAGLITSIIGLVIVVVVVFILGMSLADLNSYYY